MQIRHRYTGVVLHKFSNVDIYNGCLRGSDLINAEMSNVNLAGVDFRCAYLFDANFSEADLTGADFRNSFLNGADLTDSILRNADLRKANLHNADLTGADFHGARLNWTSHELMSELICQGAGRDISMRSFAGLVLIQKRSCWCWRQFLKLGIPEVQKALEILAAYVIDDDDAPDCVHEVAASLKPGESKT